MTKKTVLSPAMLPMIVGKSEVSMASPAAFPQPDSVLITMILPEALMLKTLYLKILTKRSERECSGEQKREITPVTLT